MGYVAFTNKGTQPLTIPINTLVATNQGVQFLTQGEVVVQQASTFPAVQITARDPGALGNVPIGTITVIPSNSINAIALASGVPPASVSASLTVTNPTATSGGKAGSTSPGTNDGMSALRQKLHQQMQVEFNNWLKGQLHDQDVAGNAIPDISSSNPLPQETFVIGTPAADGSFSGTDSLQATVLVVRTADLQAAARAEVQAALAASKQFPGYAFIPSSSLTLGKISPIRSKDGKSLSISFKPKGLIGQSLSNSQLENLRSLLAGRKASDVNSFLTSSASGLKHIVNSRVTLFPSFFSNIPFWTVRINIHVQYQCTGTNCLKG